MLREVRPDIPVLFLDTVHHFPQTSPIATRSRERWGLNLVDLRAPKPAPGLWQETPGLLRAPQGGAALRRARALRHLVHRRCAASSRHRARTCRRSSRSRCRPARCCARSARSRTWTTKDVWTYAKEHDIPLLPLYDLGYTSIGCEPCTTLPLDPDNERSGRWGARSSSAGFTSSAVRAIASARQLTSCSVAQLSLLTRAVRRADAGTARRR